jgi:hypothetical protein
MPRFPVNFGKRKSTADNLENASPITEPSFRVLDRAEVTGGKSFDGGARLGGRPLVGAPRPLISDAASMDDDNIFAGLKTNRYAPSIRVVALPLAS